MPTPDVLQGLVAAIADAVAERLADRLPPIKDTKPTRTSPPDSQWLTTKQAAKLLSCSFQFLEKLRTTGGGPDYSKFGVSVRYRREDLDAFMAVRKRKNTARSK